MLGEEGSTAATGATPDSLLLRRSRPMSASPAGGTTVFCFLCRDVPCPRHAPMSPPSRSMVTAAPTAAAIGHAAFGPQYIGKREKEMKKSFTDSSRGRPRKGVGNVPANLVFLFFSLSFPEGPSSPYTISSTPLETFRALSPRTTHTQQSRALRFHNNAKTGQKPLFHAPSSTHLSHTPLLLPLLTRPAPRRHSRPHPPSSSSIFQTILFSHPSPPMLCRAFPVSGLSLRSRPPTSTTIPRAQGGREILQE